MANATRSVPTVPLKPMQAQPASLPPAATEPEVDSAHALDRRGLYVWLAGFGLLFVVQLLYLVRYVFR